MIEATLHNTLSSVNLTSTLSVDEFFTKVVKATGYPFFEYGGLVYRVTDDHSYEPTGRYFSDLTVTQDAVLQYAVSLGNWMNVNSLIADMRNQVEGRLGTDYSDPRFDE